jgi:hypothetical protein
MGFPSGRPVLSGPEKRFCRKFPPTLKSSLNDISHLSQCWQAQYTAGQNFASPINDTHGAGAEVTKQQKAVLRPSTVVMDLWHARQRSVSESSASGYFTPRTLATKNCWSKHIDLIQILGALLALQLP